MELINHKIIEKTEPLDNETFMQQEDSICLANEMFEGTKPLTGEAYDILIKVLYKNSQRKSTTKGML